MKRDRFDQRQLGEAEHRSASERGRERKRERERERERGRCSHNSVQSLHENIKKSI